MKKLLAFLFLCACLCPLFAEVGVLSISSDDVHSKKEDFWHTFEYYVINPYGSTGKCQATRIGKKWFATAAHCVYFLCQKGCTIRMDLMDQPYSIFSTVKHSTDNPIVFIPAEYASVDASAHDFALLNIDLDKAESYYYKRGSGEKDKNMFVSQTVFNRFLQRNKQARQEYYSLLRPIFPPLLFVKNETFRLNRTISVISIFQGVRQILQDTGPVDYVKDIHLAYTPNFGVKKGMSGSGVMANTGELVGIVSGYLNISFGKAKSQQYLMFSVFDEANALFMEEVMGSDYYKLDRKEASEGFMIPSPANHEDIINGVRAVASVPYVMPN